MKSLVMLFSIVAFGGCKVADKSSVESLENLAGGKGSSVCSATPSADYSTRYDAFWAQKSIVADNSYKSTLSGIFAAVPSELQSWFFLKGGKVQLIGNPVDFCKDRNATPLFLNSGSVGGCMNFEKTGSDVGMPTIYVGITESSFQGQQEQASLIVQGFAAVLSSFLSEVGGGQKLDTDGSLRYTLGGSDTEMRGLKTGLAFIVIEDLLKLKREDGKTFAEGLPEQFKSLVKTSSVFDSSKDRNTRWSAFWNNYNDIGHRDFINYIVGQVFETKWCNDSTRLVLEGNQAAFKDTGTYFNREVAPIFAAAFTPSAGTTQLADSGEVVATGTATMGGAPSADAPASMAFGERIFPVLGAVLRAPFAVANYFVENRPVLGFFQTYQPVRRVLVGALQLAGGAARFVIQGTGAVINGVGQIITGNGYYGGETYSGGQSSSNYYQDGNYIGNGLILNRIGYRIDNGCLIRRWRC